MIQDFHLFYAYLYFIERIFERFCNKQIRYRLRVYFMCWKSH